MCAENRESSDVADNDGGENVEEKSGQLVGCEHYKRNASLVSPCCETVFPCRLCHDASQEHTLDRSKVSEVVCRQCGVTQPPTAACCNCGLHFAKYFCATCRLYDDSARGQFHCDQCGICRVGGRENFFHCSTCDLCLPNTLKEKHKCIEAVGRSHCSVCLEDLHSARSGARKLPCGHLIHQPCYAELVLHGATSCPQCNLSLFDMSQTWASLDLEVKKTKLPAEYRHCFVNVLCRDCQALTETEYSPVALKCAECGSYNTSRDSGPIMRRRNSKGSLDLFACLPNVWSLLSRARTATAAS